MDTQDECADQVQSPKKRVLIVDDHPIFRLGLAGLISEQPHLEVCGHAESAPLALEAQHPRRAEGISRATAEGEQRRALGPT